MTVESQAEDIFFALQPVLDKKQDVWGYELLFRDAWGQSAPLSVDWDVATARMVADAFSLAVARVPPGRRILVNFTRRLILDELALALPRDSCVVEILETVEATPDVIEALGHLRSAGYQLAMDDYVGGAEHADFLPLVTIVKIDVLAFQGDPERLATLVRALRPRVPVLLAEKVEDVETFKSLKGLGVDLYQGYFFARPEFVPGKKLSSGELSRLRILEELKKPELDIDKLGEVVQRDISLSYRLLRLINSAVFGLRSEVRSVRHAISMLGERQVVQWLRVVVLADLTPNPRARELALMSVHRARFFEQLAIALRVVGPGDELFLLGLFSLLDAILGQPMDQLVESIALDAQLKAALLGKPSDMSVWLELVAAYERGNWERVDDIASLRGIDSAFIAKVHTDAGAWAQSVLGSTWK